MAVGCGARSLAASLGVRLRLPIKARCGELELLVGGMVNRHEPAVREFDLAVAHMIATLELIRP